MQPDEQNGLLTTKQIEYLRGNHDPSNERRMRMNIRERVTASLAHFMILFRHLDERDAYQIQTATSPDAPERDFGCPFESHIDEEDWDVLDVDGLKPINAGGMVQTHAFMYWSTIKAGDYLLKSEKNESVDNLFEYIDGFVEEMVRQALQCTFLLKYNRDLHVDVNVLFNSLKGDPFLDGKFVDRHPDREDLENHYDEEIEEDDYREAAMELARRYPDQFVEILRTRGYDLETS